jgi:uncharacterized protein with HEPN domain
MHAEDRDPACLWDMRQAALDAVEFVAGLELEDYLSPANKMVRSAVERELETVGEAARRVSRSFRDAHPEVPWGEMVRLRNVIPQEYDRVDNVKVSGIVRSQLPDLLALLGPLVPPAPENHE